MESTGSDPGSAALFTGLGLGGLYSCYEPLEVGKKEFLKSAFRLLLTNFKCVDCVPRLMISTYTLIYTASRLRCSYSVGVNATA